MSAEGLRVPRTLVSCPYFRRAFGWSVPIGALAGLVGLGGGEFRLPVLMHAVGFDAKPGVPLNLLVSAVTDFDKDASVSAQTSNGTAAMLASVRVYAFLAK